MAAIKSLTNIELCIHLRAVSTTNSRNRGHAKMFVYVGLGRLEVLAILLSLTTKQNKLLDYCAFRTHD